MARFQFRLKTLLGMRLAERDERRALLAESYAAERQLQKRRAAVEGELAAQHARCRSGTGPGRLDVEILMTAHRYEQVLRRELQALAEEENLLSAEIDVRRQAVVAADREVRVLEKLRDRQHEHYKQQQAAAEGKQMDEVAARSVGQPDAV